MKYATGLFVWLAAIAALSSPALAETTQEVVNKAANGLALTPPMGWNSWNIYASKVTQELVLANASEPTAAGIVKLE